jgi:GcrA cell cycle regulator
MHIIETTWTDARVEQLRQLHAEGMAFSLIGIQLGISRNACIGKAQRLGLDARPHFNNAPVRKLAPEERAERARMRREAVQRRYRAKMHGVSLPAEPLPAPAPVPLECRPCSLLELSRDRCKWPIGDPGEPSFVFCGGSPSAGKPYCGFHCSIAYKAPPLRGRVFIQARWNPA